MSCDKKRYCLGCEDDFYNGKNEHGIKECWHFKDAKVVWRKPVGTWERPPWTSKSIRVLDCFRKKGTHYVDPKRTY